MIPNVEMIGAARLYRVASVLTDGLGRIAAFCEVVADEHTED